ncbi:hypothetical protein PV326_000923, partial [Microctonus aethiopoides]
MALKQYRQRVDTVVTGTDGSVIACGCIYGSIQVWGEQTFSSEKYCALPGFEPESSGVADFSSSHSADRPPRKIV